MGPWPALLLFFAATCALAQDYAREERWKAEVLGNLVVGDAVDIRTPSGRAFLGLYTAAQPEKPAVLLVHGLGVHPDHGVIGSLRMALADMGHATLSVQMPVLAADAQAANYYPALFPEAASRIAAAARWLRTRNHRTLVLASHSLGSWMAQYHLENDRPRFAAWINMGGGGPTPRLPLPVLDVYGEKDNRAVLESAGARAASRQVMVPGADHFFHGKEQELAALIRDFISRLP